MKDFSAKFRISTRDTDSISNDGNRYANFFPVVELTAL